MPQPKLYEVLKKKPTLMQKADNFWPLPDTFMGVEIEIEGLDNRDVKNPVDNRWQIVQDHSLRNGEEWVLATPLLGVSLREAIHWFFNNVTGYRISTRTSTHIHINMMDDNSDGNTLRNMLGLYIAAEDFFFRVAGDDRKWSGYCAPLEEAPVDLLAAMIAVPLNADALYRSLKTKRANADRYYALNLLSLEKHGTFEFRHFPCTHKEEDVVKWIRMVMNLKLGAVQMTQEGVDAFAALSNAESVPVTLNKYLPTMAFDVMAACDTYRIASKINAVYTYSNNNVTGVRYDATKPGLLKSWMEKHGKKLVDTSDENAVIAALQRQKVEWCERNGLGADARNIVRSIHDHIRHNDNMAETERPERQVWIDRYTRLLHGMDMVPPDYRPKLLEIDRDKELDFRRRYPIPGLVEAMGKTEKAPLEKAEVVDQVVEIRRLPDPHPMWVVDDPFANPPGDVERNVVEPAAREGIYTMPVAAGEGINEDVYQRYQHYVTRQLNNKPVKKPVVPKTTAATAFKYVNTTTIKTTNPPNNNQDR